MKDQQKQLASDIECLTEELANVDLVKDHATPAEQQRLKGISKELRDTVATKRWTLCELILREEGILPLNLPEVLTPQEILERRLAEIAQRRGGLANA